MSDPLADSYAYCQKLAKRSAKNFYYSFTGLPRDRFQAMCALYAYMRICDDIGDDESVPLDARSLALDDWEAAVTSCFATSEATDTATLPITTVQPDTNTSLGMNINQALQSGLQVLPAMRDSVSRFGIPVNCLLTVIAGVRTDLDAESSHSAANDAALECRYAAFEELADYCYHVAGVVGQCCIHVWGFTDPRALELAIDCGLAFQLTNVLRDIAEDADNRRVYLPAEDLQRFDYSLEDIENRVADDRFRALMKFQADRASSYYDRARELFQYLEPTGQPILQAMLRIYEGLLTEICRSDYDVYSRRISLPAWRKLLIATGAAVQQRLTPRAKEATATGPGDP